MLLDIFFSPRYNIYIMELLNPTALWKDFNRGEAPLEPTVISVRTADGITTERLYFSGAAGDDGTARVYAKLVYPSGKFGYIAVIAGAADKSVDEMDIYSYVKRDTAAIIVDYSGRKDAERFTLYPYSLAYAEPEVKPDTFGALPESPKNTCWYVWAVNYLRAVAYAEQRFPQAKIIYVGVDDGGAQAVKAAALAPAAGAVIIGSDRAESEDLAFKAALSGESYISKIRSPLMLLCGSNAAYNAAERASECFNAAAAETRMFIRPRSFGGITSAEKDDIQKFIDTAVIAGGELPECPAIEARASDAHLYCDIVAPGADSVNLYFAQSVRREFLRNWHRIPTETAGESRLARVSVYDAAEPVYLIAVAKYGNLSLSSPMLTVRPAALGVIPDTVSRSRLVYDAEMGVDDWVSGSAAESVRMGYGALGISGVTSDSDMITYKLGDCAFGAGADDVLQILIYSDVRQNVVFRAIDRDGEQYVTEKNITPFSGWTKFTLSAGEFKNKDGALVSWADAAGFGVSSDNPVVINSMLWV